MSEQSVHLQLLQRLIQEGAPLAERADALCRMLEACAPVHQVWYLSWEPSRQIYGHVGRAAHLPPGQGDPLLINDQTLHGQLQLSPRISLQALRQMPCWLAGRLRREGLSQGSALALSLQAGTEGLLLVHAQDASGQAWAESLQALLQTLLDQAQGLPLTTPLLSADVLPGLLVDHQGRPLQLNPAFHHLLGQQGMTALANWLPVNHQQLVQACLRQQRCIENVEARCGQQVISWSYIPEPAVGRVLLRGRDITDEQATRREANKAQRLYRLITENTTDLISRHTPDGRFLDASPASWTLLGYWPEELRGLAVQEAFHPQDRQQLLKVARDALTQDGYYTMTFRIRHRDGRYLWFETASRAIRETYTGAVVEVVSISRNITRRVQVEENRRRLAEVVEVNTDLVLFVAEDGRLTDLNSAARQALQIEAGADMPYLSQLLSVEDQQRLQEQGHPAAEQQGVWSSEVRLHPLAGGASFPVSLVLLAHHPAGDERYYSLVARNMTERELREAQQRRHQDELAHTARLITLGELASGIAHEINQPLAAIMNYASASQRYLQSLNSNEVAAQRVAQGLERITEHADHAGQVIKRLRAFLRKGQRKIEPIQVAQMGREAIRLCAWEATQHHVRIDEQWDEQQAPVYADPVLLEQVLLNLLRNAIDANREQHHGKPSQVLISTQQLAGGLRIVVQDQGPGVSDEVLGRMFTPFYTSKPEGLGLGLSMSRSIVEGFGGSLQAEQLVDGGLQLTCYLPVGETAITTRESFDE